jgi:hypothetical protein
MKWPRRIPLFYNDGRFRCRVSRGEVEELLAQRPGHQPQADAECWRCNATTEATLCCSEQGHEWILILRPINFRRNVQGLITSEEIEANSGARGFIPRASIKRKLEQMFEES